MPPTRSAPDYKALLAALRSAKAAFTAEAYAGMLEVLKAHHKASEARLARVRAFRARKRQKPAI